MSLLQFRNTAAETLERGDVVVLSQQQQSFESEAGMPVVDVDSVGGHTTRRSAELSTISTPSTATKVAPEADKRDTPDAKRQRRKHSAERISNQRFTPAELDPVGQRNDNSVLFSCFRFLEQILLSIDSTSRHEQNFSAIPTS